MSDSQVLITAHLNANHKIVFDSIKTLTQMRATTRQIQTVTDIHSTSSMFGSKTTAISRDIETVTPLSGNSMTASAVEYQNIDTFNMSGLRAAIGDEGIKTE